MDKTKHIKAYQKRFQGNCRHGEIKKIVSETAQSFNQLESIGIIAMCTELLQDYSEPSIKKLVNEVVQEFNEKKEVI